MPLSASWGCQSPSGRLASKDEWVSCRCHGFCAHLSGDPWMHSTFPHLQSSWILKWGNIESNGNRDVTASRRPFVFSASALRPMTLSFWLSTSSMPCASRVFCSSVKLTSEVLVNIRQYRIWSNFHLSRLLRQQRNWSRISPYFGRSANRTIQNSRVLQGVGVQVVWTLQSRPGCHVMLSLFSEIHTAGKQLSSARKRLRVQELVQ